MDADNISNARIMNAESPRNILTELGLSSDAYALLAVMYYVRSTSIENTRKQSNTYTDPLHRIRSSVKSTSETNASFSLAV